MAIIGKKRGTGMHVPWDDWPPSQTPTVRIVRAAAEYPGPETAPLVNPNLTEHQQKGLSRLLGTFPCSWASKTITKHTNLEQILQHHCLMHSMVTSYSLWC